MVLISSPVEDYCTKSPIQPLGSETSNEILWKLVGIVTAAFCLKKVKDIEFQDSSINQIRYTFLFCSCLYLNFFNLFIEFHRD